VDHSLFLAFLQLFFGLIGGLIGSYLTLKHRFKIDYWLTYLFTGFQHWPDYKAYCYGKPYSTRENPEGGKPPNAQAKRHGQEEL